MRKNSKLRQLKAQRSKFESRADGDSNFLNFFSVVVGSVHFRVFPVICHLSKKEDVHMFRCCNQARAYRYLSDPMQAN